MKEHDIHSDQQSGIHTSRHHITLTVSSPSLSPSPLQQVGMHVYAVVVGVNKQRFSVDLSVKPSHLRYVRYALIVFSTYLSHYLSISSNDSCLPLFATFLIYLSRYLYVFSALITLPNPSSSIHPTSPIPLFTIFPHPHPPPPPHPLSPPPLPLPHPLPLSPLSLPPPLPSP